ncbi:hypothetical protein DMUE_0022 [Dictyocoela muelleri]|nr:hypothetical protein DMUE_0022 [Dictyocoela muelleri]
MIEEYTRDFYCEIVPDRTQNTFSALSDRYIEKRSIIITDGYASYPVAVLNNQCSHLIVNHSQGFKNIEAFYANNIENLWSLFKYEWEKRRGVLKNYLEDFLLEFKFRYKYLRKFYSRDIRSIFKENYFSSL